MAYKTDGTANFNFFINRQGPRGPQGIEGEQGFSPSITEGENTAETYTLQVNNKDGSFTTPNLKPQFQDRGGDVVKVDREHDTLYFGTIDIPNAVDLTTDQSVGGNKTFIGNSTFTGTSNFTGNVSITGANLEVSGVLDASSATITNLQVPNSLTSSGVINAVAMNAASIKNNQNNKYYLTQSSITAGDNVTIEETTDGVKISSIATKYTLPVASSTTLGGIKVGDNLSITEDGTLSATSGSSEPPVNMVTTDTAQTITGAKTLGNSLYVNNPDMMSGVKSISTENLYCSSIVLGKVWTSKNSDYIYANGYRCISAIAKNGSSIPMITCNTGGTNPNNISFGASDAYGVTIPAKAETYGGKKFLIQGSVTAGSDNLLITETADGVQIICNAPTNEQIEILQRLINDLSTKIDNLTNRVVALEEQIDGGVASSIYAPEPQKLKEQVVEGLSINEKINNVSEDVQVNNNGGI